MNQAKDYIQNQINDLEKAVQEHEQMLVSEKDTSMKELIQEELSKLKEQTNEMSSTLLSMENPENPSADDSSGGVEINENVITLEIRAGTGGEEAGLFARDLYKMYSRYGEKYNWKITEDFVSENEAGGIKTLVVEIRGKGAYTLLKHESGVHRVQRVPITESGGRIHTSTATVAVLPTLKKVIIEIKPEDLKWEFYRAGGHGGQNINKVSTAVRLTHIPTQTIIECQEERFQAKNRNKALSILESKLYTMMNEQQVKSVTEIRTNQVGTADRSEKIRTYNYPQDRVTDHRINKNWHGMNNIMNGAIEDILSDCTVLDQVPQQKDTTEFIENSEATS